ncbi:MAG: hypothetical protein HAW67_03615 [Endozoicomonadaceae bacterium]|nr:hypothetical protein [Endozoicomonadaceae bacterium]
MDNFSYEHETAKAHTLASGWSLSYKATQSPFSCHCFYVNDIRNNHLQMFSISMDDFDSVKPTPLLSAGLLAGNLCNEMTKFARNPSLAESAPLLSETLSCYIKQTQVYQLFLQNSSDKDERIHAIINIYPTIGKTGPDNGLVRPCITRCNDIIMSRENVADSCRQLLEMDKSRHPKWFK